MTKIYCLNTTYIDKYGRILGNYMFLKEGEKYDGTNIGEGYIIHRTDRHGRLHSCVYPKNLFIIHDEKHPKEKRMFVGFTEDEIKKMQKIGIIIEDEE